MRAWSGVTFWIGRQSNSVRVGDEQSIFMVPKPFFFFKKSLHSITVVKSVLNSVNFEMNKVSFHKQGQVFLRPRLWLTTSQTPLNCPPPPTPHAHTPPLPERFPGCMY